MINALWITSDRLGCGTYRAYIPALSLQESKLVDSNFLFHHDCPTVEKVLPDLDGIDVVIFQRAVGTLFVDLIKECQDRNIATVFEFDDNVFDIPRHNPAAWFWRRKAIQRILRQELEMVDAITVSTRPLMDATKAEITDNDKVHLCMNHLHPAVWGKEVWGSILPYGNTCTVIGWQGSTTHDTDFKMALPALTRLLDEFPKLLIRFFGSVPLSIKDVIPEKRFQWTKGVPFEQYPSTLRFVNFDIGIAPVTDSFFNYSKSNIKWLEYSALGIPAVCSRVYPYAKSVEDGVTGYLASTTDEWYEKLRALVLDADLRKQIGQQAQAHVWQEWSYRTHAPKWAAALSAVATAQPSLESIIAGD